MKTAFVGCVGTSKYRCDCPGPSVQEFACRSSPRYAVVIGRLWWLKEPIHSNVTTTGVLSLNVTLFGGWIRCRDTVVDVHERRSNEPCSGAEPREVMPLVSYRASVEAVLRWKRSDRVVPGLHEIHEVAGLIHSAKQVLTSAYRGRPPSSSAMSTRNRLPKRLVWAALFFLFTGVCTASAEIEDFVRQVGSPPIGGATGALSAGAVVTVITSVALGVLYFWVGYGLLRRQERWRWRAVYLSRILIGFLGLGVLVFLFGEVSSIQIEGLRSTGQLTETLPLPRWTIRSLALLLLGAAMGAYWWALRVLQSDSIQKEFLGEKEEATSTT